VVETKAPAAPSPVSDGSRASPDDPNLNGAATALAAGLTTITAALAAFGTAGGILERMSINSPGLTRWGFGFAALAVALAITARVAPNPPLTRGLLAASALLFGGALFILVDRAAQIPSTRERLPGATRPRRHRPGGDDRPPPPAGKAVPGGRRAGRNGRPPGEVSAPGRARGIAHRAPGGRLR
jgi:hypothetical protein